MSNIIPYKVLVKILLENGWELDHTTGSHEIYIKDGKTCPVKCTKKELYTQSSALNYYLNSHDEQNLHPLTANLFERILRYIANYGENTTFKRMKDLIQQKKDLYTVSNLYISIGFYLKKAT